MQKYYTLTDNKGEKWKEEKAWKTIADIIVYLADFYSPDWTNVNDPGWTEETTLDIYTFLSGFEDEDAQLEYLLNYGDLKLIEHIGEIPEKLL